MSLFLGAWGVVAAVAAAPLLQERHLIHDAGQPREFLVALDEVEFPQAHRVERVAGLLSAEAISQYVEGLRRNGHDGRLVLYERGVPRSERTRRILTRQVVLKCVRNADLERVRGQVLGGRLEEVTGLLGWYQCEAGTAAGALALAEKLSQDPQVVLAQPVLARQKQTKSLPNDPLLPLQWHLLNTGQSGGVPGIDINVTNVWETWRGAGIVIGVVDDGLQTNHPDLAPNVSSALGWNFNDNKADPSPVPEVNIHGTAVAGVAGACGNNGLGVSGVAYQARLAGLRLLGAATTDSQDAAAMLHSNSLIQVKNNSWGAQDGSGILEGPGPLMSAALAEGVASGRGGLGTVSVFAGGNGHAWGEDANYDGYANSINVIAVGAVNDWGEQASYSEPGACLVVAAPSGDYGGHTRVVTTDLVNDYGYNYWYSSGDLDALDYTRNFTGTSAATPMVSGVIALLLEANPGLGYRDVPEVLMRSATRVSADDGDWVTNSAGLAHNHKFGGGLVNAGAALQLATHWMKLGPVLKLSLLQTNLGMAVPDNNPDGITNTFLVTNAGFRVEHVALTVTLPHPNHGDLAVSLFSPSGVESRLAELHNSSGTGYSGWTLSSVRHWGERAVGTWKVKIADHRAGSSGTLNALHLQLQGSEPEAVLSVRPMDGGRQLVLRAAAPGWRYDLETSSTLTNWARVATLTVGEDGRATYLGSSGDGPATFYRARLVP
jgi:subtilisin-like proprotein convertase family protein